MLYIRACRTPVLLVFGHWMESLKPTGTTLARTTMHKLTFFPLGNADCIRIELEGGKQLLFDYAAMRDADDATDRRIDLPAKLREDLAAAKRSSFDVVVFTHLDNDHIKGATEFFWLDHAAKYQGAGRIKIPELWVPAAAIIEEGAEDETRILRAEARYRLKAGKGIRVFSRPERLKAWFEKEGISIDDRRSLITDAGQIVPGFDHDAAEFFVHSPFAMRQDDNSVVERNDDAIVLHATFASGGRESKVLLTSDVTHEVIADFVRMTRKRGNDARLEWDVIDVPHHCSYTGLAPDKGKDKTIPVSNVKWLYDQGQLGGVLVSGSDPIPDGDTDQPPHRQAAKFYEDVAARISGEFKVTMQHPTRTAPAPLVIKIDATGATTEKQIAAGVSVIVSRPAPRAG